jgi:hypothetical protein
MYMSTDSDIDQSYLEDAPVWVRYPLTREQERGRRDAWPWLAGVITAVRGPDEWQVCVEDERAADVRPRRRALVSRVLP